MPNNSSPPLERISRLALVLLLAASAGCGLWAIAVSYQRTLIRHTVDYEEGNVLNAAVRINQGLTPYPDPNSWPVVLNPYGPVPYYLVAVPVHFWGPSFAPARMVMVIAAMLGALFVGLILHHETRSALVAWTFGSMYVSFLLIQHWMPVLRVDLLGITIVLAGLYVFVRKPRLWWLAVALFVAALFTKYSLIAAPLACFAYLVSQKEWKRATQFNLLGVALTVAGFGLLQWRTQGAFAFDMFGTHPDPYSLRHYLDLLVPLLLCNVVLVVLAMSILARAVLLKRFDVLSWYLMFGILASLTGGKLGSNENHMLELAAVFCLNAGVAWKWLYDGGISKQTSATTAALLMVAILFGKTELMAPSTPNRGCLSVYDMVRWSPAHHILSEDVGALVTQGKTVEVSNPFVYGQLARAGKVSDAELQRRIGQHYFGLIVVSDLKDSNDRWSPEVLRAIGENYQLAGRFSCPLAELVLLPRRGGEQ